MLSRASDLTAELSTCSNYASLEQMLFRSVAGQLGAETGVLLQFRQQDRSYSFRRNTPLGVSSKAHDKYIKEFHRADPVLVQGQQISKPNLESDVTTEVFRLSDVCDEASFTQTQYYNDFLKPAGIRHVLALAVRPQSEKNDLLVVIGFLRPLGARNFGQQAIQSAIQIAPVVGSTIARLTFKENLTRYRELAKDMTLLTSNTGFILLDDQLEVQEFSPCAGVSEGNELDNLLAQVRAECTALLSTGRNQTCFMLQESTSTSVLPGERLNVAITLLKSTANVPRYIVQLSVPHTNLAITSCASELSWTSRECDIVMAVAQGLTNPQIADFLMISVRTVENHLRAIYSKANITSRSQLLGHLLHYTPTHRLTTSKF